MLKKGTKIYSVLRGKCPSCHKGDFFKHSFTMNLFKVNKIKKTCSCCNLKYMIEPAFYFGALYVSYGITVALCIVTFVISKLMLNVTLLTSFITIFVVLILFIPVNLRLSRILWINMFVSYKA
ncbi:MAG: hypothetical protein CMQ52_01640 [Gammaproteobacteria bacterium]|nr:hypothetical protein [Gammaproteobacteria bacterium]